MHFIITINQSMQFYWKTDAENVESSLRIYEISIALVRFDVFRHSLTSADGWAIRMASFLNKLIGWK